MESVDQAIIPGLPDDLALRCLAKVSHGYHGLLETISKGWRGLIRSPDYSNYKAREGWCGDWLFVLNEGSNNQWVAYDPDANRWHPLSNMPGVYSGRHHYGFSCVSVCNKFMVIGGSYAPNDPIFLNERPLITNDVLQFDPFKKQWIKVASMQTPRSHFACSVVRGKVYVAGGRSSSCVRGLALVEVYDPTTNKWEDLPPLPNAQMDCLGLSYKGKLHVLSDQVGMPDQKTSEVFNPSDGTWCTVDDIWPFSRAMNFTVQVMGDGRVYTVVDWGESSIKMWDARGEWHHVGSVPSVVLPDHSRRLGAFGYGFAALRHEIYILGGRVLKWEESGVGRFDIVKLCLIRVCDPDVAPLKWRETRLMCCSGGGSILGCASMEEKFSL
ncbi:F-box/kelch-repeat protein At1g16250-like isoform X2 [Actinidia eriantha]|uniref:F-box/kelch-repeat protein At1g16250-like isoform X2 n=1 Tax=Actinidia eriantha TaxID=165200 RepID=UPI002583CF9C|nr:F-box/kelch-repeat protein At1g16250-like isoform X2 [Actinidia eriantha]XP_057476455.1 F-box/kelch-repeat protein At1g16250-like isoform X2 [Actinidia eriantha]XP_057476457.1 F-box/kelch-repeat protein At1g16250-like isoform X2 [Actinidia eriantha]